MGRSAVKIEGSGLREIEEKARKKGSQWRSEIKIQKED